MNTVHVNWEIRLLMSEPGDGQIFLSWVIPMSNVITRILVSEGVRVKVRERLEEGILLALRMQDRNTS